jgi:adenylate cyclase
MSAGGANAGFIVSLTNAITLRLPARDKWLSRSALSLVRRKLRMASGLVLFTYITSHLLNHALGLISLETAENGLGYAIDVWYSTPGTLLLYGAALIHFSLALWAVYERRTFRLPPAELVRIALGFTLPLILINHYANTRLAWDVFGLSSDYTRIVADLWITNSQGMQLGIMAPGWIHGCLGLHFAFSRRPLYRKLRLVLFAVALLLPVFSALGFFAMGKELATNPTAAAAAQDYLGPAHATERNGIARWHNQLLIGYFCLVGAAFAARAVRNAVEHGRKKLIAISYPGRTVRVPRGWSVLEASRGFHLAHASMCGGRARCSTCRVRVTAGEEFCPPAGADERATLDRIGASPDVRLACQLHPFGPISVVPLVGTARPVYRATAPQRSTERDVVVMFCDFLNREELARDQLPQDLLYLLTLYGEAVSNAIRADQGTISRIGPEGICALFGLEGDPSRAARRALSATAAIQRMTSDLDNRLGPARKIRIAVAIHAGHAAVGEITASDPPTAVAVGEAMDSANELRTAAIARGKAFAISEPVTSRAEVDPAPGEKILLRPYHSEAPIAAILSDTPPVLPDSSRTRLVEKRAALQRLWRG